MIQLLRELHLHWPRHWVGQWWQYKWVTMGYEWLHNTHPVRFTHNCYYNFHFHFDRWFWCWRTTMYMIINMSNSAYKIHAGTYILLWSHSMLLVFSCWKIKTENGEKRRQNLRDVFIVSGLLSTEKQQQTNKRTNKPTYSYIIYKIHVFVQISIFLVLALSVCVVRTGFSLVSFDLWIEHK